jgi:hypothetical protein
MTQPVSMGIPLRRDGYSAAEELSPSRTSSRLVEVRHESKPGRHAGDPASPEGAGFEQVEMDSRFERRGAWRAACAVAERQGVVERIRRRFVEHGLEAALNERPRPSAVPKLDERGQATLIALACSNPPEGRTCWTMQLLANELVVRLQTTPATRATQHSSGSLEL